MVPHEKKYFGTKTVKYSLVKQHVWVPHTLEAAMDTYLAEQDQGVGRLPFPMALLTKFKAWVTLSPDGGYMWNRVPRECNDTFIDVLFEVHGND